MGIVVEILEPGVVGGGTPQPVELVVETAQSVVIETLTGTPATQNVFVGPTPPSGPQEGWVWIDTS